MFGYRRLCRQKLQQHPISSIKKNNEGQSGTQESAFSVGNGISIVEKFQVISPIIARESKS